MQQLKMWWKRMKPDEVNLPAGFTVRTFRESDIDVWIEICKAGKLLPDDAAHQNFVDTMVNRENLNVSDIIFIEHNGRVVATTTPVVDEREKLGYVHMVAVLPEFRGFKLGKQLNNLVMNEIYNAGCENAYLTTDDDRIPAIKSYLTAGFYPVLYDVDMEERWRKVMQTLEIHELSAVDESGEFCETITLGEG